MYIRRREAPLCALACLALAAGAALYPVVRGAQPLFPALAAWTGALPTLLHSAAFVALSLAVIRPWPRLAPWICAGWLLLEGGLEIIQVDAVAQWAQARFSTLPPLLRAHVAGTFDVFDLLAAAGGVVLAGAIATTRRPRDAAR